MKTDAKILFLVSLLLTIGFAIGCQQGNEASSGDSVADIETDQTASKQPDAITPDTHDQDATEESGDESSIERGESILGPRPSEQEVMDQKTTDQKVTEPETTDPETTQPEGPANETTEEEVTPAEPTIDIPATWTRVFKEQEIWIDLKNKQVIVGGKICLDAGPLEMLICPGNTKAHESVVSANAESWQVHAALTGIGATPGTPCRWNPEYTPAWGPKIDLKMMWRDEKTKQVKSIDGKQWVLNIDTQKPMTTELVFGGSFFSPAIDGGQPQYQANAGELICLANFGSSTIDLQVSKENIDLFFEANTPLIPPVNTQVYTVITFGPVIGKPEE